MSWYVTLIIQADIAEFDQGMGMSAFEVVAAVAHRPKVQEGPVPYRDYGGDHAIPASLSRS
jgi:hypothetical protein